MISLIVYVNHDRIYKIAEVFKELGVSGIKKFEEIDQQYHAVKRTLEKCSQEFVGYMFYINALLTYKLKMVGEVFWETFANYVINNCISSQRELVVKLIEDFTYRFNNYLIDQKIRRLRRITACNKLWSLLGTRKYLDIAKETAKCLKTSPNTKTIVFSIKILYYVHKAQGLDTILPFELPIPVDRRVVYVTYMSGLIDITNNNYKNKYTLNTLFKIADIIRKVWSTIALESGIPPLHIDSVVWYFGKYSYVKSIDEVLIRIDSSLYKSLGEDLIKRLVKELFYRLLS